MPTARDVFEHRFGSTQFIGKSNGQRKRVQDFGKLLSDRKKLCDA